MAVPSGDGSLRCNLLPSVSLPVLFPLRAISLRTYVLVVRCLYGRHLSLHDHDAFAREEYKHVTLVVLLLELYLFFLAFAAA